MNCEIKYGRNMDSKSLSTKNPVGGRRGQNCCKTTLK